VSEARVDKLTWFSMCVQGTWGSGWRSAAVCAPSRSGPGLWRSPPASRSRPPCSSMARCICVQALPHTLSSGVAHPGLAPEAAVLECQAVDWRRGQVWRLTEGWRDSQHMLGSYLGSPWSSAGTALAALRLPQHADTLAPGDKIQIGVFRHDKGGDRPCK
jgi:hypothetical protein